MYKSSFVSPLHVIVEFMSEETDTITESKQPNAYSHVQLILRQFYLTSDWVVLNLKCRWGTIEVLLETAPEISFLQWWKWAHNALLFIHEQEKTSSKAIVLPLIELLQTTTFLEVGDLNERFKMLWSYHRMFPHAILIVLPRRAYTSSDVILLFGEAFSF